MKTGVQVPGKALEKPSDCVPHTFVPGANPSKQAAARQFDQAFTKLHKDKYDISVVKNIIPITALFVDKTQNCPYPLALCLF